MEGFFGSVSQYHRLAIIAHGLCFNVGRLDEGVLESVLQLDDVLAMSRSTTALPLLHLACASMSGGWLKVFSSQWCN